MATIAPALTFGALFRDPAANTLGTTDTDLLAAYRVIYAQYRVEDTPLMVAELEQEILTDFLEPIGAVDIMAADSESKTGNLKVTHGYARYASRAGQANVDRGATFGFEGEVDGTDAPTAAFDRDQLGMMPYVSVPRMPDRHQTLLAGEPSKAMVGPFEASAANVHTVRTRGAMFIYFELVALLLDKDLTAREAYLVVYPFLEDRDLIDVCRPLVEFLQVGSTQPTDGNPRSVTLQDRLVFTDHPVCASVLHQRRTSVLYRILPALFLSSHGHLPDTFAKTLAEGLANIAVEMHADRRSRETRVSELALPKTFIERYGDRIAGRILLLTASSDDDLLPPFYQELGGKQKGESDGVILQREVHQSTDTFDVLPFKVSPSQVITLKTFDFAGLSMSKVGWE
jgi:hypothetical protein